MVCFVYGRIGMDYVVCVGNCDDFYFVICGGYCDLMGFGKFDFIWYGGKI